MRRMEEQENNQQCHSAKGKGKIETPSPGDFRSKDTANERACDSANLPKAKSINILVGADASSKIPDAEIAPSSATTGLYWHKTAKNVSVSCSC